MILNKFLKKIVNGAKSEGSLDNYIKSSRKLKNWENNNYSSAVTQRNILLVLLVICFGVILISLSTIRYLKNSQNIDPFVIEIEKKTGVPTVVKPISVQVYSAEEAVKRYFIMKYIRAREEYYPSMFSRNFKDVVRALSSSKVYYNDYRMKFNVNNSLSPYNLYGNDSYRNVNLKSIIFPSPNSAQVRITLNVSGKINSVMHKIVYIEFSFKNLNMSESDRLINPLGFQVTLFRMNDESS